MKSTILAIYENHRRSRFPNDTKGKAGGCSLHSSTDAFPCDERGAHDVLTREESGTEVWWGACKTWVARHPDAVAHIEEHGYAS